MIQIHETSDYRPLIPFFIENELEFEEDEEYGEDEIVKCWRADAAESPDAPGTPAAPDAPAASGAPATPIAPAASGTPATPDAPAASGVPAAEPRLVGACILARREGEFICDGIAVDPGYRKSNLGKQLLDTLLKEAKSRGADKVFLVARAPGFFAKAGFLPVQRKEAPEFFECFTCPQYGKTCHPEVMRLNL
jgi:GNAT superfamily N-acetyltransferase